MDEDFLNEGPAAGFLQMQDDEFITFMAQQTSLADKDEHKIFYDPKDFQIINAEGSRTLSRLDDWAMDEVFRAKVRSMILERFYHKNWLQFASQSHAPQSPAAKDDLALDAAIKRCAKAGPVFYSTTQPTTKSSNLPTQG